MLLKKTDRGAGVFARVRAQLVFFSSRAVNPWFSYIYCSLENTQWRKDKQMQL